MFKNKRFFHSLAGPLFLAVLIGIIFSLFISLNILRSFREPSFNYLPIFVDYGGPGDDFFQWACVRKYLSGQFPVMDSYIFENRNTPNFYFVTRSLAYFFNAVVGFFTQDILRAYLFSFFFFPALNFLFIYFLTFKLTSNRYYSSAVACFILIFYRFTGLAPEPYQFRDFFSFAYHGFINPSIHLNEFGRSPDVMISNIGLFAFCIALYQLRKRPTLILACLTGILLGCNSYCYAPNGMIAWSIALCYLLYHWKEKTIWKLFLIALFVASIVDSGLLYSIIYEKIHLASSERDWIEGTQVVVGFLKRVDIKNLSLAILGGIFLFLMASGEKKSFVRILFLGCMVIYFIGQVCIGGDLGNRLTGRGFRPLWLALSGVVFYQLFAVSLTPYKGVLRKVAVGFIVFCLSVGFLTQVQTFHAYSNAQNDKRGYLKLMSWLKKNTLKGEVVVSLDPDVLILTPVYTPLYIYVPPRVLSVPSKEERWERFYESLAYSGVSVDAFQKMLEKDRNCYSANGTLQEHESCLFDVVLFWDQFQSSKGKPPPEEISDLVAGYKTFLDKKKPSFSFWHRANYFIVSSDQLDEKALFHVDSKRLLPKDLLTKVGSFFVYRL